MEGDLNQFGVASCGLINSIIDDFPQEVCQPTGAGAADIHAGPLSDGLKAFKDFYLIGVVSSCAFSWISFGSSGHYRRYSPTSNTRLSWLAVSPSRRVSSTESGIGVLSAFFSSRGSTTTAARC